jgi:transcriptional regulator with XRE-family HTH domain
MWTNSYSLDQLGEFLRDVRRSIGLTQASFAKTIGVSHATLSNLELGKNTSTETLQKALQFLSLRMVVVPKTADVEVIENPTANNRD